MPLPALLLNGLQHIAIIAPIGLVFPLLVLRAAGADTQLQEAVISASLVALGLGSILLCARHRALGSGYLAPAVFTAAYLPASLMAAQTGGLPLVFGMTIFAGCCEVLFSFFLRRLRPYLPVEIAGLAVVMIGFILGLIGFRLLFGLDSLGAYRGIGPDGLSLGLGFLALAVIIGLNVWARGVFKVFSVLIGVVLIYPLAWMLDRTDLNNELLEGHDTLFALPTFPLLVPTFDIALAVPFMVGALACALRAIGDITTCQRITDPNWVRPDMTSLEKGVRADGIATLLAGAMGTVGLNTFSGSVGLSQATGMMQRRIGYAIGGLFILLSLFPHVVVLTIGMPDSLTGAILIFSSAFILANGLSIIVSRMLDERRIIAVGVALILGISHDIFPQFYETLPHWLMTITGSSLVVAVVTALLLNGLFRIGISRKAELQLPIKGDLIDEIVAFCRLHGAHWGARRDVIDRVINAMTEAGEMAVSQGHALGTVDIELHYDEYRILARMVFTPDHKASGGGAEADAIDDFAPEASDLELRLMRHFADKVSIEEQRERRLLRLVFQT
ncbi:solute carrier family 23 protein [Aquibaculum arenosum]|uniref:Solute carrier family 23 protein n=1 Tax=Aquibaculum arenosum TaxID=3032591 RepID=A0ABT5YN37_9PROT|nr:solute carrier family 23 protein [Fodinicurvata sp. CAU 1616]MDF2096391.1 solute carrier family 23 protein [Fodinicurvata sp. CAU 1616]